MKISWMGVLLPVVLAACSESESTDGNDGGGGSGSAGVGGDSGVPAAGAGAGGQPPVLDGGVDAGVISPEGPQTLFETGLYADAAMTQLAPGVMEFSPQFPLWSDSSAKRRFILLPAGTQIDTTDMDHWIFPVGTKVWKEFTRDNVRVETRLLWKQDDAPTWFMGAYIWSQDSTMATRVPRRGQPDVRGTTHDIPSSRECGECHQGQPDKVLGFSAIQLSHDGSAVNLQSIKAMALLSVPPAVDAFTVPGNALQSAALGLMHANCGQCHNPLGVGYDRNQMELWLTVSTLGDLTQTSAYQTAVGVVLDQDLSGTLPGITQRVVPGDPLQSALYLRMNERDETRVIAMPPIGTELVDTAGTQLIFDWISSLPPSPDGGGSLDGG